MEDYLAKCLEKFWRVIMIRDMELMLNTVYDDEIKAYLSEALACYSAGAYRASIIMVLIGGIYDLHNKLISLSSSNHDIAKLESEVSKLKKELKPYERVLIDGCATDSIDLLSSSEAKELNRCFDIRNDCAHPSEYICTGETARYVFTTIIDVLASKPILLGQQHITTLYNNIVSDNYFPRINKEEIRSFVQKQLGLYSKRIYIPLAQRLAKSILEDTVQTNNNKIFFLSNMENVLSKDFDRIISPLFLNSKFQSEVMILLSANTNIIDYLSSENIKRIINIFKSFSRENHGYNSVISEIILNTKLSEVTYDESIVELLNYDYEKMTENQISLWKTIVTNSSCNPQRATKIKQNYINNIESKTEFSSQRFQEIFILCNNELLYTTFIKEIAERIADSDYTISNPAVSDLEELDEQFINCLQSDDICIIMYSILCGHQGYGREVTSLLNNIKDKPFYKRYLSEIIPYFNNSELEKMLTYNLTDTTYIKFVSTINESDSNFNSLFISVAENYINKADDEWNSQILTNCIDSLKNKHQITS